MVQFRPYQKQKIKEIYDSLNSRQKHRFNSTFMELVGELKTDEKFNPQNQHADQIKTATPTNIYALDMQYPTRTKMLCDAVNGCLTKIRNASTKKFTSNENMQRFFRISQMLGDRLQKINVQLCQINEAARGYQLSILQVDEQPTLEMVNQSYLSHIPLAIKYKEDIFIFGHNANGEVHMTQVIDNKKPLYNALTFPNELITLDAVPNNIADHLQWTKGHLTEGDIGWNKNKPRL